MSYHIYQTDCFVLCTYSGGEANRTYTLFTEGLGVLDAKAQGVRLLKSKLRMSLVSLSRCRVSLVRGKEIWRIVGAESIEHYWRDFGSERHILSMIDRITVLLRRLLPGEGTVEGVFEDFTQCISYLQVNKNIKPELLFALELIIVARILHRLGYFAPRSYTTLLEGQLHEEMLENASSEKNTLVAAINEALHATHL